ncbi:PREDICTED: extracellular calcium-sensing receptor-like [Nanorana parkeri]|uniref:extracellular calcium-sensing receptor-like n=1 Tax=Nanorana parkeri TaxID=125878 RepID=UPI000854FE80|nr:PREDICTED: extracellular calcium-sensing receptor-like [Nanorana parkeri]
MRGNRTGSRNVAAHGDVTCCHLSSEPIGEYLSQPGDLLIGGTFTVHMERSYTETKFTRQPEVLKCQFLDPQKFQRMQAMIFAIEEINKNPDLLPNITLGYWILDSCSVIIRAAGGTLWILSGGKESVPNYRCEGKGTFAGIVGDSGSAGSIIMAQILGLYRYPQISYFATSPTLSNRNMFPSFFRTVPSDAFQSQGLAKLILYFGWSWVGFVASDNYYGQMGLQVVKQEFINAGTCEAFTETIMTSQANRNAPHIVKVIKNSTVKVVVVVSSNVDFLPVVEELTRQNVTGRIWIASESWSTSALLSKAKYRQVLVGTVGFAVHGGQMPGFMDYLHSLHPSKAPNDSFIVELWEQIFSCRWTNYQNVGGGTNNKTTHDCTGEENLAKANMKGDLGVPFNVYTSVYAFAWAFHSLLHCQPGKGPFHNGCSNMLSFYPWQLLHYIKTTRFQTKDKTHIFFDDNGDPPALYDIVNWQISSTGSLEQAVVGKYDSSSTDGKIMSIDSAAIVWDDNDTKVPPSKCSSSCPPGFMKVAIPGKPICCFQCLPCPQGEISNETDAVRCHPCPWNMCSNLHQDACMPRVTEFLSYSEVIGIILATIAIVSSAVPLGILGVFIHYRTTPIVRANNWSLSCLLLISLCLCFLCSLAFIGQPQPEKCLLRQVTFGLAFSLCISCVLAKTITVVIAFKATKPGTQFRKFTGIRMSYSLIALCVLIQVSICVAWLSSSPPFPEYDTHTQAKMIIFICNEGSPVAFWSMLGYLGLLATISFIIAFLARRLPDSYNEAKFITFSMLAFLSVWISYIPASLSSQGKYIVATEIFAILSSSWALVFCIFLPKCFIILFRPDMNSKEHLMRKNQNVDIFYGTTVR